MLFVLDEPKICQTCSSQIIPKNITTFPIQLYEDNQLMRKILRCLQQGDFSLLEVILPRFYQILDKFKSEIKEIKPYESKNQMLDVLVETLNFKGNGSRLVLIAESLPESLRDKSVICIL